MPGKFIMGSQANRARLASMSVNGRAAPGKWTPGAVAYRKTLDRLGGNNAYVPGSDAYQQTLDLSCLLDFANSTSLTQATRVGPAITFSRPSSATYFDATGTRQTAAAGEARFDHDPDTGEALGLLIEQQQTNSALNAASPATQTVSSVPVSAHTVWIEGTGSVAVSGATDGSFGTATEGSPVTFTPSATQDVTLTVSGTVTRFQLEDGAFATSFIETAGSAVTRAADVVQPIPVSDIPGYDPSRGVTLAVRHAVRRANDGSTAEYPVRLDDGSNNYPSNYVMLRLNGLDDFVVNEDGSSITDTGPGLFTGDGSPHTLVLRIGPSGATIWEDGAQAYSDAVDYSGVLANVTDLRLGYQVDGTYKRLKLWPRLLSDAECQRESAA